MSARDRDREAVKRGLEKQDWRITHDPLWLKYGANDVVQIDLAGDRVVAAERDREKIAVEVKSFLADSPLSDFHPAIGQFLNYRLVLEALDPDRVLYLAVPLSIYRSFFQRDLPRDVVRRYEIKLIIYNPILEEIVQWIG
ncbi:element excision factor XisH family protein [Baaleninema simplex]|uniref:element excision factor XisH family protein n=1 Tax=Baaleninema simplex TaxID=2862350 RepID=UPI00034559F6|nr:element excision factor XisH family protein [Baaleninema simplex]